MEQAMKIINDKMDRIVEEKAKLELALVDIIDEHNIKKQEARQITRSKMNKIKKYVLRKEMCPQYAFGAIVILVAVIIAMSGFFKMREVVYDCIQQGNDCQHCMLLICM
jgi:hypothetical protein